MRPIIIQDLTGTTRPRGNALAATKIYESDGGMLKVQTDIYDEAILGGQLFETEIFRALALECIYHKNPVKAGKSFHMPPAWLVEGLAEEMRSKENGPPDEAFIALLRSEKPPKIEDLLKGKPELMEATSLALYRVEALALLNALEQLPDGKQGLVSLLESIKENEVSAKTLLAAFPSLKNDPSRLLKIWTLAIARASTNREFKLLSISETERMLDSILDIKADSDPKKPGSNVLRGAAALSLIARREGGPFIMRQKSAELLGLELRSHPLLKPIITEYHNITTLLAAKPKKNVEKRIADNEKILALLKQRGDLVSDYLNWFEATQLDTLSGDFPNMSEPPAAPKRTDPITQYLDFIEQNGW